MTKFLAVYTGTTPPEGQAQPLSQDKIAEGMAAWGDWMSRNATQIVDAGGPLGVTKRVSPEGVADTHNNLSGYVVIEAQSHAEAASLFEGHPHFSIFPGDAVEIMECLPIPGAS